MKRIILILMLAAMPLAAGNKAETLESLLRELRELRAVAQREKEAARAEQRQLDQLLALRRTRVQAAAAAAKAAATAVKEAEQKLADARRKKQRLTQEAAARRRRQQEWAKQVLALIDNNPLLAGDDDRRRLQAIAAGTTAADVAAANFWNTMLAIAVRGVETEVTEQRISLGGTVLTVSVLRLGALGCLWLTADASRAGIGRVRNGALQWQEIDGVARDDIVQAFRVARREIPAVLVAVPIEPGDTK